MKLPLLAEGPDWLAIDKPSDINVHSGHGRQDEPTIVSLLEKRLSQPVYLVHRLDRDTSGVLLVAKTNEAKKRLQKQFEKRTIEKVYLALVHGKLEHDEATIDLPIGRHAKNPMQRAVRGGGKPAITGYKVIRKLSDYSLLEVHPKSGRTHQIRVHLGHLGHPVVGDWLYGKGKAELPRLWLHAAELSFTNGANTRITVKSPLPAELRRYLARL